IRYHRALPSARITDAGPTGLARERQDEARKSASALSRLYRWVTAPQHEAPNLKPEAARSRASFRSLGSAPPLTTSRSASSRMRSSPFTSSSFVTILSIIKQRGPSVADGRHTRATLSPLL